MVGELSKSEVALRTCGRDGVLFCDRVLSLKGQGEGRACNKSQTSNEKQKAPAASNMLLGVWKSGDALSETVAEIGNELQVDFDELISLVGHARKTISAAHGLAPHFGVDDLQKDFSSASD